MIQAVSRMRPRSRSLTCLSLNTFHLAVKLTTVVRRQSTLTYHSTPLSAYYHNIPQRTRSRMVSYPVKRWGRICRRRPRVQCSSPVGANWRAANHSYLSRRDRTANQSTLLRWMLLMSAKLLLLFTSYSSSTINFRAVFTRPNTYSMFITGDTSYLLSFWWHLWNNNYDC